MTAGLSGAGGGVGLGTAPAVRDIRSLDGRLGGGGTPQGVLASRPEHTEQHGSLSTRTGPSCVGSCGRMTAVQSGQDRQLPHRGFI